MEEFNTAYTGPEIQTPDLSKIKRISWDSVGVTKEEIEAEKEHIKRTPKPPEKLVDLEGHAWLRSKIGVIREQYDLGEKEAEYLDVNNPEDRKHAHSYFVNTGQIKPETPRPITTEKTKKRTASDPFASLFGDSNTNADPYGSQNNSYGYGGFGGGYNKKKEQESTINYTFSTKGGISGAMEDHSNFVRYTKAYRKEKSRVISDDYGSILKEEEYKDAKDKLGENIFDIQDKYRERTDRDRRLKFDKELQKEKRKDKFKKEFYKAAVKNSIGVISKIYDLGSAIGYYIKMGGEYRD